MHDDRSPRELYLEVLSMVRWLIAVREVRERWDGQSALAGFSVAGLAGHLVRGGLAVQRYLEAPPPRTDSPLSAAAYWEAVLDPDPASPVNIGVRERGEALGSHGIDHLIAEHDRLVGELQHRLPTEPPDRLISVFHDLTMSLDDYLVTRIVEAVVHLDDLAVSVDIYPELSGSAMRLATDNLLEVARLRHGDLAVLRAFSRGERQSTEILRIFSNPPFQTRRG